MVAAYSSVMRSDRRRAEDGQKGPGAGALPVEPRNGPLPADLVELVQDHFRLPLYETRLLLALMRAGSATTRELASLTGVPRTAMYQVLEGLHSKGLAERLAQDGPAVWAPAEREDIFLRLDAEPRAELEQRLRRYDDESGRIRDLLVEAFPPAPDVTRPHIHVLHRAVHVKQAYDRIVRDAREDLVMFTRPPYATRAGYVNPAVLDMLRRGVKTRVLYQEGDDDDPSFVTYRKHGVEARVAAHLPVKLVVADGRVALVVLTDPSEVGYPTTMLIDHHGYASVHARYFEDLWGASHPFTPGSNGADATQANPDTRTSTPATPGGSRRSVSTAAKGARRVQQTATTPAQSRHRRSR